jgi:hypothetical protein
MRRAAVSLSILLALAAAPLSAQIAGRRSYDPPPSRELFLPDSRLPGPGYQREVASMRENIRRARAGGLLSRREARRLDREARRIRAQAWRYGRDGLSDSERAELDQRAIVVRQAIAGAPAAAGGR